MGIRNNSLVIGATTIMVAAVTVTATMLHLSKGQAFIQNSPKELVDEVWQIIDRNYVDATFNQVDWRAVRTEYLDKSYINQEQAYEAVREMLAKLDDPYTRFMDPQEFRNMQIDTQGELTGVGIQLSQDEETEELIVVSPIEDTPAFAAGIKSRDVITKIDGQSTEGMDVNQAVSLIRGPVNSKVTLTIRREDEPQEIDFEITRARIEIHPVRFSVKDEGGQDAVGYIRLNQFSANATSEMKDAIKELEKEDVAGYILDLRGNPGGLLYSSIEISRMWLEAGTIVTTVNRQGIADREEANESAITDKPLVILVDGGSASASEILSGALQDNDRATLVGTKTFGKGLVQSVRPLGDGSGLAVTIARYQTPSGRDINKQGIEPDIILELSEEQRETFTREMIATLEDPQYAKALEILEKEVVAYRKRGARSSL